MRSCDARLVGVVAALAICGCASTETGEPIRARAEVPVTLPPPLPVAVECSTGADPPPTAPAHRLQAAASSSNDGVAGERRPGSARRLTQRQKRIFVLGLIDLEEK